ncbi:MAG: AAA family ATPase [Halobacteriovoraceae bacterium]|nr:AAA family ATPase [Halobacteriovoraceae bacterium]
MSTSRASQWLISHKGDEFKNVRDTKTICVTSGKGGVGKTSIALKTAFQLSAWGHKTLLIDCDFNLSNALVKIGKSINNHFALLLTGEKDFSECVVTQNNVDILSGCNGSLELFDNKFEYDKSIINIINTYGNKYDFIILDSPAGIDRINLNLNAYSDYRFVVVTPDRSSLTDSYSLIKILKNKYGIISNHLLVNKCESENQYKRVAFSMADTVDSFLSSELKILGSIEKYFGSIDKFDQLILNGKNNPIHKSVIKILKKFTEEVLGRSFYLPNTYRNDGPDHNEQNVLYPTS